MDDMSRKSGFVQIGATMAIFSVLSALGALSAPGRVYIQKAPEPPPNERIMAIVTAYSSEVSQTDDTPEIMASGQRVFDGAAACPRFLDFKTKIIIDGKLYICHDRMAERYRDGNFFDLWFQDRDNAIQYGRQTKDVLILMHGNNNQDLPSMQK